MSLVFVLVFFLLTLLNLSYSTLAHGGNETDSFALLSFKSNLYNTQQVLNSWNHSVHFCEWEGVTCGRLHKRVTILNLKGSGLSGPLAPNIGNLSFLQQLSLQDNNFLGEIPNEISHLFRLRSLSLQNNFFEGKIPPNLSHCINLKVLNVSLNKLVGEITREFSSLSKLTTLIVLRNNLSGEIHNFIRNLTSLEIFEASYNLLRGDIPTSLGELRNITKIKLIGNKISGTVPLSLYNLSSLAVLHLSDNQLFGNLPEDLGLTLPRIQSLLMKGNHFNGTIPLSLSNASKLAHVDFAFNYFTGKLPNFGNLKSLSRLAVFSNFLGTKQVNEMSVIIHSLTNCSLLTKLSLDVNQFSGTIPNSVGNLSVKLEEFGVAYNRIHGVIPLGLGNLVNLFRIQMGVNQFEGQIPNDIYKLEKLFKLHLFTNQLSGQIPDFIGNMSMLSVVYLDDNRFEGTIASSLGNCKNLIILTLDYNNLRGTIPKELFDASSLSIALSLSNNHLVGQIPFEVSRLKNLGALDLSNNKLSGEIPTTLGDCNSLETLSLSDNFFNGSIPLSLKSLGGLQYLDLSNNNLSGTVPKFLENFSLSSLNLSFNDFEGELPTQGVFANSSAISVKGNSRLCGGILDLWLPRCKITAPKQRRLAHFQIILISGACSIFAASIVLLFMVYWRKNKKKEQTAQSSLKESFLKISYGDLVKATNEFSSKNILGMGSFGTVYKGILDPGEMIVAVKVLNLERFGASKSFTVECKALRNIRHRNLLKIITSCSSTDFGGNEFKALVYEFMPNGSLETWLHSNEEYLNLRQRIDIAMDVAYALDYLHHQCGEPIIHCDLKPNNVLLDVDMVAHVGDFGLARFQILESSDVNQSRSVGVKGTIGYAAPEYGLGNEVSTQGDIYSYGILLLEMMIGKSPTDPMFNDVLNLHNHAKASFPDNVMEIVEPKLLYKNEEDVSHVLANDPGIDKGEYSVEKSVVSVVKIGVACSMESPQDRIGLDDVIRKLHSIKKSLRG